MSTEQTPSNSEIVDYYRFSKFDYRLYNGSFDDLSMHYGLWDQSTSTHRDALANENRVLSSIARIGPDDHVIDLGCGYGSTAIWLARNIGCRVTGITLSADQVAHAQRLARKNQVESRVRIIAMDYHRTGFTDATFDAALAIESICHSSRKLEVLKETWRILKPGGRLAVADAYYGKPIESLTKHEREIAETCFTGVHIPPLPEKRHFEDLIVSAGFSGVRWSDRTLNILPTAVRVNRLGKILLPISKAFSIFGLRALQTRHMRAFIYQLEAFRGGLGVYGIFSALKSHRRT